MAATYTLSTDIGKVRLYASDTNIANTAFSDEEWQIFIDNAQGSNLRLAAAWGLRTLARDLARLGHWKDAGVSNDAAADMAVTLAEWLEQQALAVDGVTSASILAIPYAGGISVADRDTVKDDSDRVVPAFSRSTHFYDKSNWTEDE